MNAFNSAYLPMAEQLSRCEPQGNAPSELGMNTKKSQENRSFWDRAWTALGNAGFAALMVG